MLRLATRAGMAHITRSSALLPVGLRFPDGVEHADGWFRVGGSMREEWSVNSLWSGAYDPIAPLRVAVAALHELRSSCPACLRHHVRSRGMYDGIEFFNYCSPCDLHYVDVCVSLDVGDWLLPYLSRSHYLHALRSFGSGGML